MVFIVEIISGGKKQKSLKSRIKTKIINFLMQIFKHPVFSL